MPRVAFRRGFVEAIKLDARMFAEHGEEIVRRAPLLRSLTATGLATRSGDPLDPLRAALASLAFQRLDALELVEIGLEPMGSALIGPPPASAIRPRTSSWNLARSPACAHSASRRVGSASPARVT